MIYCYLVIVVWCCLLDCVLIWECLFLCIGCYLGLVIWFGWYYLMFVFALLGYLFVCLLCCFVVCTFAMLFDIWCWFLMRCRWFGVGIRQKLLWLVCWFVISESMVFDSRYCLKRFVFVGIWCLLLIVCMGCVIAETWLCWDVCLLWFGSWYSCCGFGVFLFAFVLKVLFVVIGVGGLFGVIICGW